MLCGQDTYNTSIYDSEIYQNVEVLRMKINSANNSACNS